jgi:hypothetical protein
VDTKTTGEYPLIINIGNLEDISAKVDASDINNLMKKLTIKFITP